MVRKSERNPSTNPEVRLRVHHVEPGFMKVCYKSVDNGAHYTLCNGVWFRASKDWENSHPVDFTDKEVKIV